MLTVSQSQSVGKCRAAGLSKPLKSNSSQSKCQPDKKQKDISAYFRNSFAFHKRYLSSVPCTQDGHSPGELGKHGKVMEFNSGQGKKGKVRESVFLHIGNYCE